jgi:predicted TPR repeat methyltransferase
MNRQQRRERARQEAREACWLRQQAAEQQHSPAKVVEASHRLFHLGRIAEALPALQKAITEHPEDMPLRTSLAYALAATGNVSAAIAQYREMLRREPNSPPLLTNLAVLLIKLGTLDEARDLLLKAAALAPEHANTAYTLGELFEQRKRRDQAFHHYRRAALLYGRQIGAKPTPALCNDLVKLASAQMWTGDIEGALASFDRAIDLRPDHALALARRGLLLAKLRRVPEAIESLKRAAAAEPNYAEVRRAIGDLLLDVGDSQAAQSYYRAAVRINPRDALAGYFLAAARSEAPEAPPPGYVEQLFDDYAQRFEKHLVDVLQYRAPELLCEAIRRVTRPPAAAWNVIDLGCGTGLCGPLIRPYASRLTGVDLSAAMLDQAREKSVYDELVQEDVSAVFGRFQGSIDLALSADVFIYLGSLTPIFTAAGRALRPGGWFAFTTEVHDGEGFLLDTTGRYRHARAYVEAEAAAQGLETVHFETIVARYQSHQPVMSDLYILRRAG